MQGPPPGQAAGAGAKSPTETGTKRNPPSGTIPLAGAPQTMHPAPSSHPVSISSRPEAHYDPRELDEEVDLQRDRRKQLLDLYYRLNDLDYYEALGVDYAADKKEIRAAYFALSKIFHPDSMFRKNLGSFKPKMEAVFKYLTESYETLSKKKQRDEYDGYLRATKATQLAEAALRRELQAEARALAEAEAPPPASEPPSFPSAAAPPEIPTPREVTPEARRLAQEVIAKRLRGVTHGTFSRPREVSPAPATPSPPAASSSSEPPASRTDPQELLRRLTRTLKDVAHFTGTNDQVTRAVKASQAAFARGDLNEAASQLSKAVSLAPEREDLRVEYERLSKMVSEKMVLDYIERAKFEQKNGKWASAALSWAKVCEGRPNDADAYRFAAHALYKAGGDLRGAQRYAQQAAFLAPEDIDCRILLTQIYLTIGLKLNARRELDVAAKLDPGNEMVKNLLADLKT